MRRRAFLGSAFAGLSTSLTNRTLLGGLGLLNTMGAAGSSAFTDNKSLVMVFLNGGVDSLGLLVPTGASQYAAYKNLRQHLAFDQSDLINLGTSNYATPNCCQSMVNLFNAEKLSWISNIGPLRQPTTKQMIVNNERVMPYFVGSHNSQQIMWQSGSVDPSAREGWGGKMLDLISEQAGLVSPNISLDGTQLFTSTLATPTFSINPEIIQNIAGLDPQNPGPNLDLFYAMQSLQRPNALDNEVAYRNRRTVESSSFLSTVMRHIGGEAVIYPNVTSPRDVEFQHQLKMAARLVEAAPALGHPRQVIMVQMNGFDTHDNQDFSLPDLLQSLFENLEAFQSDLESRGLDHRVVTFSQSDFGRTPSINANGTDHGWGGHSFLMGTPVRGGQIVGEVPDFDVETEKMFLHLLIPDFSVEQYASNLARWFGLSSSEISEVLPNLSRFNDIDFELLST